MQLHERRRRVRPKGYKLQSSNSEAQNRKQQTMIGGQPISDGRLPSATQPMWYSSWSLPMRSLSSSLANRTRKAGRKRSACQPSSCCLSSLLLLPRLLLLLLFASATLHPTRTAAAAATTTTSLPTSAQSGQTVYHEPELSSFAANGISKRAAGNQRQVGGSHSEIEDTAAFQQSDLGPVQVALISVRGSLAFWRPAESSLQPDDLTNNGGLFGRPSFGLSLSSSMQKSKQSATQNNGRPSHCPKSGQNLIRALSSKAETPPEIVAVEGTSIKLNLVILGQPRKPLPVVATSSSVGGGSQSGEHETLQQQQQPKLRLMWTHNGDPITANSPRSRFSQQLLISDTDPRQLLVLSPSSHHNTSLTNLPFAANLPISGGGGGGRSPSNPSQTNEQFMLAPYVADQQSTEAKRLLGQVSRRPPQAAGSPLIDDFLAEGQSIDWPKLEAYLRFGAQQLGFQPPPSLDTSADCSETSQTLERLALVQVELSRLSLNDHGLYRLRACLSRTATTTTPTADYCPPQVAFALQVAEDVPHLEGPKPEHRILEPGERLSIKCEATGFTLPQITWFLDGQQLNEHNQATADNANVGFSSPLELMAVASQATGRLRIGDYVSQDNRVHSFVNSSQVQASDGGFYKCQANNGLHSVERESRIDVRGPPVMARPLANTSVLVGQSQLHIQCPFSGYPITSVEWYFRPVSPQSLQHRGSFASVTGQDGDYLQSMAIVREQSAGQLRARRGPSAELAPLADGLSASDTGDMLIGSRLDEADHELDPDHDEWLAQANSMTPSSPEDYPEPMPDYPAPGGLIPPTSASGYASLADYDGLALSELRMHDYSDIAMDLQQGNRRKRDTGPLEGSANSWIKFPQSRRHQVHLNGTLILQDVSRTDQGFYKCRALQASSVNGRRPSQSQRQSLEAGGSNQQVEEAQSNELYLTVLVPPVISPFGSAETLREGMRNFLTCSVIEGDSPVRMAWLKDGQPIEEYMAQRAVQDSQSSQTQLQQQQSMSIWGRSQQQPVAARIRVDTTNEYTSTLYFSQVDFKDNGNYTCMASNKAASVNYTAKMLVNVPPKWIKAPKDIECVAGHNIVIDCQAQAHPSARVWWEIGVYSPSDHLLSGAGGPNHQQNKELGVKGAKALMVPPGESPGGLIINHHQTTSSQNAASQQQQQLYSLQPPNHYRTIISNSRIHILENASLVIREVNKLDQGYYLCQAANNFGSLSSLIKLTVNVGASFPSKYLVKYVKLNERIELDCDPIGQSPVDVTWYMRQSSTSTTTNPMAISNNNTSSQQQQPVVDESLGRRLFAGTIRTELQQNSGLIGGGMKSQVAYLDHPQQQQQQQQTSGDDRMRQLHVGLESPGQFELASQVVELDSSMSFELVRRSDGQSEFVRLIVKQARRLHSADFICQASNRYGNDEKLIKLMVQEAPDPVQGISANQVGSRSVSLTWAQPYNGNSPITSYTVEWAQAPATGATKWSHLVVQQPAAIITPLEPMTSYEIRVWAHNQFGQSVYSPASGGSSNPGVQLNAPPILVTTIEEAPNAPPSDIRATPLSSSSIQLSWLPPPDALQNLNPNEVIKQQSGNRYPIKGYYLGYKMANMKNDSFIHKEVTLYNTQQQQQQQQQQQTSRDHLHPNHFSSESNLTALQARDMPTFNSNATTTTLNNRLKVIIGDLKRNTKYVMIVQAFNSAGFGPQSDQIEASTLLNDPPPAPSLRVGTVSYKSIELQWSFQLDLQQDQLSSDRQSIETPSNNGRHLLTTGSQHSPDANSDSSTPAATAEASIDGYHLYYRSADSQWLDKKLTPETHQLQAITVLQRNELALVERPSHLVSVDKQSADSASLASWHHDSSLISLAQKSFSYKLDQLDCGNSYQLYLVAYNSVGTGLPSQIIRTKTRGSAPIAPRRQDFLTINSTYVQLNLDTWMDGGCSISNFEVRYQQLSGRPVDGAGGGPSNQRQWLLLSNNISPEQRSIELRDLQPETWYSVGIIAESGAGKTEHQYSFMTLNKFGQISLEAIESTGNNLPALFRSGNGSIRSILHNFSTNSTGLMAPMVMIACMLLILFATCSLFLIRRYNNLMKDNASIDSQTTSAALSTSHYHGAPMGSDSMDRGGPKLLGLNGGSGHHQYSGREHYSLKSSPCKTTTTIVTGGSPTNGSSGIMVGSSSLGNENPYRTTADQSLDLSQFMGANNGTIGPQLNGLHSHCYHSQFTASSVGGPQNQQHHATDKFCPMDCDDSPINQAKFATLTREGALGMMGDQQQPLSNRFKTMPHNHRPVSTFIPNGNNNYQQAACTAPRYICNEAQQQQQQQQHLQNDYNQQIYSKLRLIYNSNNNYNLCPDAGQKQTEIGQGLNEPTNPVYDTDAINLAVLAQQNQKLFSCTLKRNTPGQVNLSYPAANGYQRTETDEASDQLTSLLMDCQEPQVLDHNNSYGSYQHPAQQQQQALGNEMTNGFTNTYGAPSTASGSSSIATNSTQPTTSSSISNGHNTDQLLNLANGVNSSVNNSKSIEPNQGTIGKKNQIKANGGGPNCNSQQNLTCPTLTNGPPTGNEPSDYALPFPPKWV